MKKFIGLLSWLVILALLAGCGSSGGSISPTQTISQPDSTDLPSGTPTATIFVPPQGPRVVINEVINQVDARPVADMEWIAAILQMEVYLSGEVWAKEESTALLQLDQDMIRVAPNTVFTLQQPGENKIKLNVQEGQVWLNIEGLDPGQELEVETPSAVASVRGTRFSVLVEKDGYTSISSMDGQVDVTAQGKTVAITPGLCTDIAPGTQPTDPEPMEVDERAQWGMAYGSTLDMVFPVTGTSDSFTFQGVVFDPGFTTDGTFIYTTYDPSDSLSDSSVKGYDPMNKIEVPTSISSSTYYYSFNPVNPGFAFTSWNGSNTEICTMQSPTGTASCFTRSGVDLSDPVWDNNGEWLLYNSSDPGSVIQTNSGGFLYKSLPDGSQETQISFNPQGYPSSQSWSPDGTQIAYGSGLDAGQPGELWMVGSDGSNPTLLLDDIFLYSSNRIPWTPDGKWLVVSRFTGGGLWLVAVDGSEVKEIPNTLPGSYNAIQWSPTATGYPLFYEYIGTDDYNNLYYIPSENAEPELVGNVSYGPVWSKDGKFVMFSTMTELDAALKLFNTTVIFMPLVPDFWKQ
jgi:hypothetical protein